MTKLLQKYKKRSLLILIVAALGLSGTILLAGNSWQSVSVSPLSKCTDNMLQNTIMSAHDERSALRAAYVILLRESSEQSGKRHFNLLDSLRMRLAVTFYKNDGVNAVCSKRLKYVDVQKNLVSSRVDELIPMLRNLEIPEIKNQEAQFVLCSFLEAKTFGLEQQLSGYSIAGPAMECLVKDALEKDYKNVW